MKIPLWKQCEQARVRSSSPSTYGTKQMEHEGLFRHCSVDSPVSSATNEAVGEGELKEEENTLLGILRSEMRKLCDAEDCGCCRGTMTGPFLVLSTYRMVFKPRDLHPRVAADSQAVGATLLLTGACRNSPTNGFLLNSSST